jgi:group I intron endonuclease
VKILNYNITHKCIHPIKGVSLRSYSTSSKHSLQSSSPLPLPKPIVLFNGLENNELVLSYRDLLRNKSGIYCLINTVNDKLYIGSAKDLYLRLTEHLSNKKSNTALQNAIVKYGLDKFSFGVLEYFIYDSKLVSHKSLTDLETSYIEKYCFDNLYNFKRIANSMSGYKHTDEAKLKMLRRFEDKNNHPMFGNTHTIEARELISKPGALNPMFGKKHSSLTKQLISDRMSKYAKGVGIYDLNDNLVSKFKNNAELARHLNISRVTVGKYLNSGNIYNKTYLFKVNK